LCSRSQRHLRLRGRGAPRSACTLDEGHFQLESDVFNGSFQRTGGVATDIWFVTDPNLKYGIADNVDIEANLSPLVVVRTHNARTGATSVIGGVGDLFLRVKFALVGNSGSDFALALDPFLKIPTARIAIGNGAVEGGILVPISVSLGDGWSLGSTPELDVLKDAACQPTGDANFSARRRVNLGLNRTSPGSQTPACQSAFDQVSARRHIASPSRRPSPRTRRLFP
jgi:Putative MetA-pathway of phenol degradation